MNYIFYQEKSRRVGHTTLMMEGLNFERPGIMCFVSMSHAKMAMKYAIEQHPDLPVNHADMTVGKIQFRTTNIFINLDFTRGMKPEDFRPVVVDHYAMQEMVQKHVREIERMYE